jgi:hypothetical protein
MQPLGTTVRGSGTISPWWYWQAHGTEVSNLLPDELLQTNTMQFLILKAKVEGAFGHGLVLLTVKLCHEGMLQCFVDSDSLFGMDLKHLSEEVQCLWWGFGELLAQRHDRFVG